MLHAGLLPTRGRQRRLVDIDHVRRIAQVVSQAQVIGLDRKRITFHHAVGGIVILRQVEDLAAIGLGRVAHPDPRHAHALGGGKAANLGAGRRARHARRGHALTAAVEGQAVIATFHRIAAQRAQGQRGEAMGADIFQCGQLARPRSGRRPDPPRGPVGWPAGVRCLVTKPRDTRRRMRRGHSSEGTPFLRRSARVASGGELVQVLAGPVPTS